MSEDARKREYTPLNLHPFVGLDLGERWGREVGELSQRLTNVDQAVARLELKTEALDTKFEAKIDALDAKFDELAHTVARLDERFVGLEKRMDDKFGHMDDKFTSLEKRLSNRDVMLWGMFTAMLAAIIIQKFI
jgi:predicted RNase H-like nuclease (RuvC/YqgF family)